MAKNPNFKRITRITTEDQRRADIKAQDKRAGKRGLEEIEQKQRKIQQEKQERWARGDSLGAWTEKFIREGSNLDDAYNDACGMVGINQ